MKRTPVEWHFKRTKLTEDYLRMFQEAGAHSMVLFAPRGMGKSEFVVRDLAPAAEEAGYFPVYCNLWDDASNPGASFIYAMARAAEEAGVLTKMKALLGRFAMDLEVEVGMEGVGKIKAKPKLDKARMEEAAERASKLSHSGGVGDGDSVLFGMRRVMDALHKLVGRDLLIIFDEVQTLANKPEHEVFIRSLRTLLDERRDHVKTVFTGSSQARLAEIFRRIKAPLYNFSSPTNFPNLGENFLRHWASNVAQIMGGDPKDPEGSVGLKLEAMKEGFEIAGKNPRIFWEAVMAMLKDNSVDIVSASRVAADAVDEGSGMRQRLAEISLFDRLVLREIVRDTMERRSKGTAAKSMPPLQLFTQETRRKFGDGLGMTPSPSQVQGALRRLSSTEMQMIVSKERGHYEVEDPFFLESFIEELGLSGELAPIEVVASDGDGTSEVASRPRMRA